MKRNQSPDRHSYSLFLLAGFFIGAASAGLPLACSGRLWALGNGNFCSNTPAAYSCIGGALTSTANCSTSCLNAQCQPTPLCAYTKQLVSNAAGTCRDALSMRDDLIDSRLDYTYSTGLASSLLSGWVHRRHPPPPRSGSLQATISNVTRTSECYTAAWNFVCHFAYPSCDGVNQCTTSYQAAQMVCANNKTPLPPDFTDAMCDYAPPPPSVPNVAVIAVSVTLIFFAMVILVIAYALHRYARNKAKEARFQPLPPLI